MMTSLALRYQRRQIEPLGTIRRRVIQWRVAHITRGPVTLRTLKEARAWAARYLGEE